MSSERHNEKVNACFGRVDLMDERHFKFSRGSGLPPDYFEDDLGPAKGILAALALSFAVGAIIAIIYAGFFA